MRTKTVYSADELPHLWAHGHPVAIRSASRNMSAACGTIRHWSTDMGHIRKLGEVVILNARSYSVTTSRCQREIGHAVRHYTHVFRVMGCGYNESLSAWTPQDVVNDLAKQANETYAKALRARASGNRPWLLERAEALRLSANDAKAVFKLRQKPLPALPELNAVLSARAQRAAAKAAKERTQREAVYAEQQAKHLQRLAGALELWKAGENPQGWGRSYHELPVALRLVQDEDGRATVETSHGARVLLCQALRLFRYCQALRARGETYSAQGSQNHETHSQRFQVGPYSLSSITRDGDAVVGCHSLPFAEMERLFLSLSPEQIEQASKVQEVVNA